MTHRCTQRDEAVLADASQPQMDFEHAARRLLRHWRVQADALMHRRCTSNARLHWITRGRQQTLWRACTHLHAIASTPLAPVLRASALSDYLHCLEQCLLDADEERQSASLDAIARWKASGEAQELPAILRALARLLNAHAPRDDEEDPARIAAPR